MTFKDSNILAIILKEVNIAIFYNNYLKLRNF